jgi:SAM-dependent methyltransferase
MPTPGDPAATDRVFAHEPFGERFVLAWDRETGRAQALAAAPALARAFARHHGLAAATARRTGRGPGATEGDEVRALGAFIVHPKGFHRHARGAPGDAGRFDVEVDAADGGACLLDAAAFSDAGGDEILDPHTGFGALALLALTLECRRRASGRVVACAAATVVEGAGFETMLETGGFRSPRARGHAAARFGFDLEACDIDLIPEGSPLRWNAGVWGEPAPFAKYDDRGAYHWRLHETHDAYRRRADALVSFLASHLGAPVAGRVVADIGAGDGLFAGLVARLGHEVVAIDPEPAALAAARTEFAREAFGARARVEAGTAESLPAADGSLGAAILLDVIEHLRNPPRALAEIRRALAPGAAILVATPAWRHGVRADATYHLDEYREEELHRQLRAAGFDIAQTARIRGVYDDLVVLARRTA